MIQCGTLSVNLREFHINRAQMAVTLHGTLSTLAALQISPPVYPGLFKVR